MPQVFHPSMNSVVRSGIVGLLLLLFFGAWGGYEFVKSPWNTGERVVRSQPVPFSHQHHVSGLGIDCRYCHTGVEQSGYAGIPPTKTCMTCHSQIWQNSAMLEPVRHSWYADEPLEWNRVHDLPDYVYFNHAIHVNKGIGCTSCHGPVGEMPLMYQGASLQMRWCLDCHRHPEQHVRPREQVFSVTWKAPPEQTAVGKELVKKYHIGQPEDITRCSICHR